MAAPTNFVQKRGDASAFDSINFGVCPVIFVPGVMGTRLTLATGPNWDPDDPLTLGQLVTIDQRSLANGLDASKSGIPIQQLSAKATNDVDSDKALIAHVNTLSPNTLPSVFYAARGWGNGVWDFYGAFLKSTELELNKVARFPVHVCGYDWRSSHFASGAALVQQIKTILQTEGATQAVVVTHSMGGLVTRAALMAGAIPLIAGVVHCVMPAHGAVVAYRRFQTGAIVAVDNAPATDPVGVIAALALNLIMGNSPVAYAITQARLRGPVELLPSNEYPGVFLHTAPTPTSPELEANTNAKNKLGDVYTAYAQNAPPGIIPSPGDADSVVVGFPPFDVRVANPDPNLAFTAADAIQLRAAINGARAFHAALKNNPQSVHPNTAVFFGDAVPRDNGVRVGHPTDVDFDWNRANSGSGTDATFFRDFTITAGMTTKTERGDGTVPALSAAFRAGGANVSVRRAFSVEHSTCFNVGDFQVVVQNAIFQFARPVFFPNLASHP